MYFFTLCLAIIHLVRTQNFLKNQQFLLPDTNRYVWVSRGKKCECFGKYCVRTKWMKYPLSVLLSPEYLQINASVSSVPWTEKVYRNVLQKKIEISWNSQGSTCDGSLFSKVSSLGLYFYWKKIYFTRFLVNFTKFLRTAALQNIPWLLSAKKIFFFGDWRCTNYVIKMDKKQLK